MFLYVREYYDTKLIQAVTVRIHRVLLLIGRTRIKKTLHRIFKFDHKFMRRMAALIRDPSGWNSCNNHFASSHIIAIKVAYVARISSVSYTHLTLPTIYSV